MKPLLPTAAVALILAALLAACATTTSSTGRRQYVGGMSQAELVQLGADAFDEVRQTTPVSTDARKIATVNCVIAALIAQLPPEQRALPWETVVFAEDEPNAFALPGGKVGVNSGIFSVAHNQDQLAAVLAHEIGHVVENHHDERITRQKSASSIRTVLGVLGNLAGYGNLATDGSGLLLETGFLLPGTRAQESEADIVGQQLAAKAGFDPAQAVDLWQNMQAAGGARPPQWLSTHPNPRSRMNELSARAVQLEPVYAAARESGLRPHCTD